MLTRKDILALDDLPRREVHIPEWNDSVFVRALTGAERDKLERLVSSSQTSRAAIVVLCCVDANGDRLFTDKDVAALGDKNGHALERIVSAALDFNILSDESLTEAGKD